MVLLPPGTIRFNYDAASATGTIGIQGAFHVYRRVSCLVRLLNPIRFRLRDPLKSQEPLNFVHLLYHLRSIRIYKEIFRNLSYDVTMTSLPKQYKNLDRYEAKQIIHHSKGNDESFPKMYFLL